MTAWCIRVEFHGRHAPSQTVMRLEAVIALINVIGTSPAGWLAPAAHRTAVHHTMHPRSAYSVEASVPNLLPRNRTRVCSECPDR